MYFWRNNHGNEVDCIIESGDKLTPVEIKAGKTINKDFFKGLLYWRKIAFKEAKQGFVVYGARTRKKGKRAGDKLAAFKHCI